MDVLVLNAGSTSLKFELFSKYNERVYVYGKYTYKEDVVDFTYTINGKDQAGFFGDKKLIISHIFSIVDGYVSNLHDLVVVHRIIHGADDFVKPVLLKKEIIAKLHKIENLAPLHQPMILDIVQAVTIYNSKIKQYGVFDTAFHSTIEEENYLYAIPREIQKKYHIRKYGFHGISHSYVANILIKLEPTLNKVISVHLGGGSSVCGIVNGKSKYISMGMTPEEGVIMETRSGDIGAGVILHLLRQGIEIDDLEKIINQKSGIKGLSDKNTENTKDLIDNQESEENKQALKMYINSIAEEIGKTVVDIGGVDILVFTGLVGYKSDEIRNLVLSKLDMFGFQKGQGYEVSSGVWKQNEKKSARLVYALDSKENLQILRDWKEVF
jgi:acetate kinase